MKVSQTLGNYDFPCTFSNSYGNQMKKDAYFKYLRSWGTHRFMINDSECSSRMGICFQKMLESQSAGLHESPSLGPGWDKYLIDTRVWL